LACIGVAEAKVFVSAFAEGPTELRDVFLRLGGRAGEVSFSTDVDMEYSSWFHPKNSLILSIVFLLLIEGVIMISGILIFCYFDKKMASNANALQKRSKKKLVIFIIKAKDKLW
jgi:hypothetical protein